jgi:ABC-type thiamine transport system ATPase subunit
MLCLFGLSHFFTHRRVARNMTVSRHPDFCLPKIPRKLQSTDAARSAGFADFQNRGKMAHQSSNAFQGTVHVHIQSHPHRQG